MWQHVDKTHIENLIDPRVILEMLKINDIPQDNIAHIYPFSAPEYEHSEHINNHCKFPENIVMWHIIYFL